MVQIDYESFNRNNVVQLSKLICLHLENIPPQIGFFSV